jgi:hypothetical protein
MDPLVTQTRAVCGFVQIRLDLGPGTRGSGVEGTNAFVGERRCLLPKYVQESIIRPAGSRTQCVVGDMPVL